MTFVNNLYLFHLYRLNMLPDGDCNRDSSKLHPNVANIDWTSAAQV